MSNNIRDLAQRLVIDPEDQDARDAMARALKRANVDQPPPKPEPPIVHTFFQPISAPVRFPSKRFARLDGAARTMFDVTLNPGQAQNLHAIIGDMRANGHTSAQIYITLDAITARRLPTDLGFPVRIRYQTPDSVETQALEAAAIGLDRDMQTGGATLTARLEL